MFQKVISCALSPNTEKDDVRLAWNTMFVPGIWRQGEAIGRVEGWFRDYFDVSSAACFNSGRSALFAILKAFGIGEGDEVLVQAFTCVAVPDAVLWTGARPEFVDIDETLNLDPTHIERHVTAKTKAIIVQHTFGVPAQMDTMRKIASRHNLILIEDCAHSLGALYKGKKVGTLGDAAFFSFGRDKVISSVWGGAAIINPKFKVQNSKLKNHQKNLPIQTNFWIFQQLLHPIAFSAILKLYDVVIGKVFLLILQKLRLLSIPVYPIEKTGGRPDDFPATLPNALAILAFHQLQKLDRFNRQRQEVARLYQEKFEGRHGSHSGAIYLRFPHIVKDAEMARKRARRAGILLGNWYHNIIDPTGVDFARVGYRLGSCPNAEESAKHIINLPTRITPGEARKVLEVVS